MKLHCNIVLPSYYSHFIMTHFFFVILLILCLLNIFGGSTPTPEHPPLQPEEPEPGTKGFITNVGLGLNFWDYIKGNGPRFCSCLCGKSNAPNNRARILGGQYVESHAYPWLAVINIQSTTSAAGTILNDRYIITSASQVIGLTPYDVKVTVGGYDRCYPDVTTMNQSVSSILVHPEYDPLTRSNDLALLRLSNTLTTDRWTAPICLPQPGATHQGLVANVVGWGEGPTAENVNVLSCRPREVGLPVLSDRQCLMANTSPGTTTRDKACAGTLGANPVVCSTDAGGPVQLQAPDGLYELMGVLTDSNVCTAGSGPAFYTKLNAHFSWLFQNTRDSCYCSK